ILHLCCLRNMRIHTALPTGKSLTAESILTESCLCRAFCSLRRHSVYQKTFLRHQDSFSTFSDLPPLSFLRFISFILEKIIAIPTNNTEYPVNNKPGDFGSI